MALTYIGDLSTDLDKVRFYIGDTAASAGPLPSAANFTDAELNGVLSLTGTVNKSVSAAMGAIAARWASYANITVGPRREEYAAIADAWAKRKNDWDDEYSIHQVTTGSSAYLTRVDGYSDDISAGDV